MNESLHISNSDISELVQEAPAVVSTWRNRSRGSADEFPQPAGGTPARPLFDFEEVRAWVSRNRPKKEELLRSGLLRIRVWSAIRTLSGGDVDQSDLVYWLHLELHARKKALAAIASDGYVEVPDADEYAQKRFGSGRPEIETMKSLVASASPSDLVEVSDFTLERLGAAYGRAGGNNGAVKSNVSGILASAASILGKDVKNGPTIYDPSCGIGESLIRTFTMFEQAGRRGKVIGTEVDPRVATIASIRLTLRGIAADIHCANTLSTHQFPDQRPDIIIAEPPLGVNWVGVWHPDDPRSRFGVPPARNGDLAWVVDAAARLSGTARALVLTGMSALGNGTAEERVRTSLVRSGAVEAVIALPPNQLQYTSMPLALWVLRAPSAEWNGTVSLIDASDPEFGEAGAVQRADWVRRNIDSVVDPDRAEALEGVTTATVHLENLASAGMDLTPRRWARRPEHGDVLGRLVHEATLLDHELATFQPTLPAFHDLSPAAHVVTIREMTERPESREAKLWTGHGASSVERPHHTITPRDISDGVLRTGRSNREPATGFWTEPGDIVFTTTTRITALVDTEGGHRIGSGVNALRLGPSSRFDPQYVALCLGARWNERHQSGGTTKDARLADLEIPLLPLDVQHQWVKALRDLEGVASKARSLVELAENVEAAALDALRFGNPEAK